MVRVRMNVRPGLKRNYINRGVHMVRVKVRVRVRIRATLKYIYINRGVRRIRAIGYLKSYSC